MLKRGLTHRLILTLVILILIRAHAQAQQIAKATGCKSTYSLMRLPFHDRTSQSVPDAMHTVTDCIEKLLYLIVGN